MSDFQKRLARIAHRIEGHVDRAKEYVAEALPGDRGHLRVEAYRGYGSGSRFRIRGRVLRGGIIPEASESDNALLNLASMIQRFESDEVPGVRVVGEMAGERWETTTGGEGFFDLRGELRTQLDPAHLWHPVRLHLPDHRDEAGEMVAEIGSVMVPPDGSRFGVISDVDDTILKTDAVNTLRMARTVFFGNARTRLPFPGVAALYRALQHGAGETTFNPIFYVSSSPWNLYDLISEFLTHQKIPHGPITLRDWGLKQEEILPTGHGEHKLTAIREILEAFPDLPFLLIGDSGQEDPEIYHRVVHDYPERIAAVYIRDVSRSPDRTATIQSLAAEVEAAGSSLLLSDDTLAAAKHAAASGWIRPEALEEIRKESGDG